ncbi:MAG: four helix bundle protein [Chitinophagales bacterium]
MTTSDLKTRTKKYAVAIALFCESLPDRRFFLPYAKQLVRASSSVGANYRAACRAKSTADFIKKLKIVEEECDETMYFMELIVELDKSQKPAVTKLWKEGNEILSIIVASIKTLRQKQKRKK